MPVSAQQAISDILRFNAGEIPTVDCFVSDVVAASIRCSPSKLRQDRHKCRGIPYSRFGRSVRYSIDEITKYMASTKIVPEKIC